MRCFDTPLCYARLGKNLDTVSAETVSSSKARIIQPALCYGSYTTVIRPLPFKSPYPLSAVMVGRPFVSSTGKDRM